MKTVTLKDYRSDKYYPRIVRAVGKILSRSNQVALVDVLIEMGTLTQKNYEAWRRGQVPYLERVFVGNLSKANRIVRIIGFHMHDLNMVPRSTVYYQWGRNKRCVLRFTKTGTKKLEEAYSRNYVWNRSQEKKQEIIEVAITRDDTR